ncbi:hypothetical protein McpCs1_00820 [Methanocorpusculaceae archaeon Cs1]|uniref:Uncharacterized protein n=1 Tax=Methanorbis rubei TaxID=3028300 RepID=A0AAE4MFY3_9EURY|nr:hypothetical protein [Methanocorpusculaceae archaeon Cs1]
MFSCFFLKKVIGVVVDMVSLGVTTEHTEHTEFHGKNTEYRFAYGKHGKTKSTGICMGHRFEIPTSLGFPAKR